MIQDESQKQDVSAAVTVSAPKAAKQQRHIDRAWLRNMSLKMNDSFSAHNLQKHFRYQLLQ